MTDSVAASTFLPQHYWDIVDVESESFVHDDVSSIHLDYRFLDQAEGSIALSTDPLLGTDNPPPRFVLFVPVYVTVSWILYLPLLSNLERLGGRTPRRPPQSLASPAGGGPICP
jgi:hypothetical protein